MIQINYWKDNYKYLDKNKDISVIGRSINKTLYCYCFWIILPIVLIRLSLIHIYYSKDKIEKLKKQGLY